MKITTRQLKKFIIEAMNESYQSPDFSFMPQGPERDEAEALHFHRKRKASARDADPERRAEREAHIDSLFGPKKEEPGDNMSSLSDDQLVAMMNASSCPYAKEEIKNELEKRKFSLGEFKESKEIISFIRSVLYETLSEQLADMEDVSIEDTIDLTGDEQVAVTSPEGEEDLLALASQVRGS